MKAGSIAPLLLVGGLLLVGLSWVTPNWLSGRHVWTDTMAVKFQQASQNYHAALHASAHAHQGEQATEGPSLQDARREFEQYQAELDAAESSGQRTAWILRWLGILGCAAGAVAYFFSRYVQDEKGS
jgi:hypothetical protein